MDPQARAVLDEIAAGAAPEPPDGPAWVAHHRAAIDSLAHFSGPVETVLSVREVEAPGPRGPVRLRLYRPSAAPTLPALLFLHGGGGMAGSIETHDAPLRALANRSGWAVASVGYRLAPEHPFPAPHEDCWAALLHLRDAASSLGVDPARLAVAGDSIGGLFAIRLAVMARDAGGPALRLHAALYPNTDLRPGGAYPSLRGEEGHVMTRDSLAREAALYAPDLADRADPACSPLMEPDLSGVAPALVVTCARDPLRDEGEAYAARLREAGVRVTHTRYPGMIHAFLQMGGRIDAARALVAELAGALNAAG